jgi:predicted DNA-binding transcriptional regulator AlpA
MPKRSVARPVKDQSSIRDRTLTSAEVCEIFNIPKATLHYWLKQERIPQPLYNPDTRQLLWTQKEIDAIQKFLLGGSK